MSKFGVGVGDDFPLDDGRGNASAAGQGQASPEDDRTEFEDWKRRRDAYRAHREERQRQREEWRARKYAFKQKMRAAMRESFGDERYRDEDDGWRGRGYYSYRMRGGRFPFFLIPLFGILVPIIIVAVLISIVAAIFKSPFIFLALVLIAIFYFAHRHHEWERRHRDYDLDLKPSRPSSTDQAPPQAPQGTP